MWLDAYAGLLGTILQDGYVPYSSALPHLRKLQSLIDAGVITVSKHGAGRRVYLAHQEHFERYISKQYPAGLKGADTDIAPDVYPKAFAVATLRDSKRAIRQSQFPVLLRSIVPGSIMKNAAGHTLNIYEQTAIFGAAVVVIDADTTWEYHGDIATVENMEMFFNFERSEIVNSVGTAMYSGAGGRISQVVIDWISSPYMSNSSILHCGDYDPVGLDEYLRIRQVIPSRSSLFIPQNIEKIFAKFGKKDTLFDNKNLLQKLRICDEKYVKIIVDLMDKYGCGLEQESLLITDQS